MIRLLRTNSGNTDFKHLVKLLDVDLAMVKIMTFTINSMP